MVIRGHFESKNEDHDLLYSLELFRKAAMKYLTNHYPSAQSLSTFKNSVLEELKKNGIEANNCILGTSICSDEVNNSLNIFSDSFAGPGPFQLGGISGIPFAGKTGFRSLSSHIPKNGGAVIIYGPHIGISKDGKVGAIQRQDQSKKSTCCGSLIAGLENVKAGNVLNISHNDYQQGQVNKLLIENYEQIKQSEDPIKATTEIAFNQIKRELTDIVSTNIDNLGNSPLLLIGGTLINTNWNQEDYFDIKDISIFNG